MSELQREEKPSAEELKPDAVFQIPSPNGSTFIIEKADDVYLPDPPSNFNDALQTLAICGFLAWLAYLLIK